MTYQEFLEKVKDILGYTAEEKVDKTYGGYGWKQIAKRGYTLQLKWLIGGASGGSCWGDEPSPTNGEPEPEFEELDKVLEALAPNISFLKYRKLGRELFVLNEHTETEYYGNYYEYATKSVSLEKLYNFLLEENLIEQ